jgi:hypothetical protein
VQRFNLDLNFLYKKADGTPRLAYNSTKIPDFYLPGLQANTPEIQYINFEKIGKNGRFYEAKVQVLGAVPCWPVAEKQRFGKVVENVGGRDETGNIGRKMWSKDDAETMIKKADILVKYKPKCKKSFMNKVFCTRYNRIKAGGFRMSLLERFNYKSGMRDWKLGDVIPAKSFKVCMNSECEDEKPVLTYKAKKNLGERYPIFKYVLND